MVKINSRIDNSDRTVVLAPRSISDFFDGNAVESLREGKAVVLNLSGVSGSEGMRIVDFMTGVAAGLNGKVKRVDACSYVFMADSLERSGVIID